MDPAFPHQNVNVCLSEFTQFCNTCTVKMLNEALIKYNSELYGLVQKKFLQDNLFTQISLQGGTS